MAPKPKYAEIMDYLREGIESGKTPAGSKLPSESDLMKRFGVSRIVAVNALNRLAESGLIYRVHGKGSFVSTVFQATPGPTGEKQSGSPRQIALVLQGYGDEFSRSLAISIQREALKQNVFCPLHISFVPGLEPAETENALIHHIIQTGAEGLLLFPVVQKIYNKELLRLADMDFPVVLLDRELLGLGFPSVQTDHFQMGYMAGEVCVKAGHRKILYVSDIADFGPVLKRHSGFKQVLKEYELPYDGNLLFSLPRRDIPYGNDRVLIPKEKELIHNRLDFFIKEGGTAVVSSIPVVTQYIMELQQSHEKIAGLALLTLDELEPVNSIGPPPSCIVQDFEAIASTAIDALRKRIANPHRQHQVLKVPPYFSDHKTI